jgi:hypothetical protein
MLHDACEDFARFVEIDGSQEDIVRARPHRTYRRMDCRPLDEGYDRHVAGSGDFPQVPKNRNVIRIVRINVHQKKIGERAALLQRERKARESRNRFDCDSL